MNGPSKILRFLLRLVCPRERRAETEGDLMEAFERWAEDRGQVRARIRLGMEILQLGAWRAVGLVRGNREREEAPSRGRRLETLIMDVRYGFRRILKNPASSAVAILLLTVGIGGNATVFTAVQEVFLKPPPLIRAPEELVGLQSTMGGRLIAEFGYYDYEFYRDEGEAFSDVLAYGGFPGSQGRRTDNGGGEVAVGQNDQVELAGAWVVSGNYFRVLGTPMALGPGFSAAVQAGEPNHPEVVLSHGYWTRALGGDRSVLSRPLVLNGVAFRVAGVTPPEFRGVNPGQPLPDLFIPILQAEALSAGYNEQLRRFQEDGSPSASRFLRLVARLEPGVDMDQAQAEATLLQRRWDAEFTSWAESVYGQTFQVGVSPQFYMAPGEIRQLRQALFFLWFVVGAVFLIGCTNLALLLLAQVSGREREMGIRASMGAARRRLLAQLTTESLVLSALGGVAGLGLAVIGTQAIPATLPMNFRDGFRPDVGVVLFTFGLAAVAAVLFGTLPAWKLSRVDVAALIQRPGQARTRAVFRGGLVVGQTALSILLLVGGGLLGRSAQNIRSVDLGFDPDGRWIFGTQLDNRGYSEEEGLAFLSNALDRLAQEPGIRWASVCNRAPFLGSNTLSFTAPGTDFTDQGLQTGVNLVGPDYFDAMGINILAGRAIERDDNTGSPYVAVVNETFAARMWPGENALGKTLDFFGESITVVGIAETVVYYNVRESPRRHVYVSSFQFYQGMQNIVVAAEPTAATLVRRIEQAFRELDPNLALVPMSLEGLVDTQTSSFRVWTNLIGIFAAVALFLALVGLYGVQSYLVSRRTREIGIRMAVGAERGMVVRSVVRWGLMMGGIGTLIGLVAALLASRFVRGFLFGVSPNDPVVFSVVPALLMAACFAASMLPALRASRISPVEALTEE